MNRDSFKSDEEWFFFNWLLEAQGAGLIKNIEYQPEPFELSGRVAVKYEKQLKTKSKIVERFLFHPHIYTPDFSFIVESRCLYPYFIDTAYIGNTQVIVDVKGKFNKYGDPKQFSINQKWVMSKYGKYVEKIIPEKLFKKTWVPEICRFTPKKKQLVKKYIGSKVFKEFYRKGTF